MGGAGESPEHSSNHGGKGPPVRAGVPGVLRLSQYTDGQLRVFGQPGGHLGPHQRRHLGPASAGRRGYRSRPRLVDYGVAAHSARPGPGDRRYRSADVQYRSQRGGAGHKRQDRRHHAGACIREPLRHVRHHGHRRPAFADPGRGLLRGGGRLLRR